MKKVEKVKKKEVDRKRGKETSPHIQNMIEERIAHIKNNFSGGIRGNKKW